MRSEPILNRIEQSWRVPTVVIRRRHNIPGHEFHTAIAAARKATLGANMPYHQFAVTSKYGKDSVIQILIDNDDFKVATSLRVETGQKRIELGGSADSADNE